MGKKILLADDSITIQKVIELTFSDEDFDVITVGNGRLALEKLPEVRPDIVLCDIIMPEKDGYEVCEQIKTNPAYSHVPVLLLTGAFEPFDQERAARAGYDGSLAKPFEPETLIAKVKDLLARAPLRAPAPPAAPPPPVRPASVPPATAAVAPPPVLPFQRPAPPAFAPPPPAVPAAAPSFIPDEPFGGLDESSLGGEGSTAGDGFAPVTEEESATLLTPPMPGPNPADAASTVMFRAGELPWNAPSAPPVPERPRAAAPVPPTPAPELSPVAVRAPEPVFVPESVGVPEGAEEPAVFEEVLEEDLDFGETTFEPSSAAGAADSGGTLLFRPGASTLPPIPSEEDGGTTGAFEPVTADVVPLEPEPEAIPVFEPEPIPVGEPEQISVGEPEPISGFEPSSTLEVEPFEPGPPTVAEEEPSALLTAEPPTFEPDEPGAPAPSPAARPVAAESFADVARSVAAPAASVLAPSEAAAVSVPLEMVEKIAQRVVAQISEKAVREIAWEVIPDLAEALIKQEIERLKAELQKT